MAKNEISKNFSNWAKLLDSTTGKLQSNFLFSNEELNVLPKPLSHPGVYFIAKSEDEKKDELNLYDENIIYIGMTGKLKNRLTNFISTFRTENNTHSGAFRIKDNNIFLNDLYVSIRPFSEDKKGIKDEDKKYLENLRVKGEAAKAEYECFIEYYEINRELPEFNKKDAPKKYKKSN